MPDCPARGEARKGKNAGTEEILRQGDSRIQKGTRKEEKNCRAWVNLMF